MMTAKQWPRRHPYNKRYMQLSVGKQLTALRRDRIASILALWEPRLWVARVNMRKSLRAELRRLDGLRDGVDWQMFPAWVNKNRRVGKS